MAVTHLTTAMASNRGTDFVNANGGVTGTNITGTIYSNGLSLSVAAPAGGGAAIKGSGTYTQNTGTVEFANSNGITFGLSNNGTMTASYNSTQFQTTGNYLTTAALSNHSHGVSFTSGSVAFQTLSFTNSNGISFNSGTQGIFGSHNALTSQSNQAVSFTSGSVAFQTLSFTNSNGISFNSGTQGIFGSHNAITTGALSDHSHGNPTLNLTNLSGTTASASNGFTLSLSANAPAAGVGIAAGTRTATTAGNLLFDTGNGITFGLNVVGGSIMTASHNGLTTAAQSDHSHGNPTLALTNLTGTTASASNGFTLSLSAAAPGAGGGATLQFYEPQPLMSTLTSTFAPGIGSWYIQPMNVPHGLHSGRMNFLVSHGSTSNLLNLSNGANFASNTTGGRSLSFNHSYMAALYTRGAGTNSTRWDSIWSNTWGLSISQSVGVSITNASQLTLSHQHTMNYVSQVGTNGAYTMGGTGMSHSASSAGSSGATSAFITGMSSLQNMISGAMLIPMGFETSITPGNYLLGIAYSTASTTAGTSINGASIWPVVNWMGFNKFASYSHRQFASTASSTGSQYFMPQGVFSAASASAPATINPRDVRSLSNNVFPYVNFMQSGFN